VWMVVGISNQGYSQDQILSISLEDAVRIAIEKNHDLAAARMDVEKAEAQVTEAFGFALPSLSLSASYVRALKRPVFFLPDFDDPNSGRVVPIEIGSKNSFDLSLSASQVLFNAAIFTGVGTARIYLRAGKEMYREKLVATVATVRRAYYAVLLQKELRSIVQATMQNAEESMRQAQALSSGGLISEYDALRAEVRVENLKPELMKAVDGYGIAMNNLRMAIGVPLLQELDVSGNLEFEPTPVDEGHLEASPEKALQYNPRLLAMEHQAEVQDARISIEKSDFLPTLAAFGSYQYQGQKNDLNISTSDFVNSSVIGLTLSLNIFKGFQTAARVDQARLDHRIALETIASYRSRLRTLVESIVLRFRWAHKQLGVHERTIELAERGYRIASTRFRAGAGTHLELNDAQLALDQAKLNRAEALYQLLLAQADLDEALGDSGLQIAERPSGE
jgi:outer membrane protein